MTDLNFNEHNTLYATHGLHAYAAKCPPQLVGYGLQHYSQIGDLVLDPMVGSGTTLVEARIMGRHALGYDIDPLARLIAQVKSQEVDDQLIVQAYETVIARTKQDLATLELTDAPSIVRSRATPPDFHNRDYWFLPQVSASLAILSDHIKETPMSEDIRDFLWVAFSSLILAKKSVANARDIIHSRHHYWQHSETPNVLETFAARVKRMRVQMAEFRARCQDVPVVTTQAKLGDARCLSLKAETIDLIFTSPPYATALDYPRAHFLAIAWMEEAFGVSLQEYQAKGSVYIGSERGHLEKDFSIDDRLVKYDLAQYFGQLLIDIKIKLFILQ